MVDVAAPEPKMKRIWLAAALATVTSAVPAADKLEVPLGGDRPHATIIAQAGMGTAWSWVTAQVSQGDAAVYCEGSGAGDIESCAMEIQAAENSRLHTVMADCAAGSISAPDRQTFLMKGEAGAGWQDKRGMTVSDVATLDQYWKVLCAPDQEALAIAEREAEVVRAEREAEIALLTGVMATMLPASPLPEVAAPDPVVVASAPVPQASPPVEVAWSRARSIVGIEHNGSLIGHDSGQGVLYYDRPKNALAGVVEPGMILFRGAPWSFEGDFRMIGTAYTFRKGCAPAAYQVEGGLVASGNPNSPDRIVLRGASPIREKGGCAILGYTNESPNAQLEFQLNYGDSRPVG